VATVLAIALKVSGTHAQSIRGIIVDSATSRPIAGARVTLIRPPNTRLGATVTDSTGEYILVSTGADTVRLEVQRIGYAPLLTAPTTLPADGAIRLNLTLSPAPVPLEPIAATATAVQSWNLEQFAERQKKGWGRYLGPQQIAEFPPRTAIQAVFRIGGGHFLADDRGNGLLMRTVRESLTSSMYCVPRVYIDGELQLRPDPPRGMNVDALIPVSSIRGVEVYWRTTEAPAEYRKALDSGCGIVLFWTNRAFGIR
jgi:hypothetical protein